MIHFDYRHVATNQKFEQKATDAISPIYLDCNGDFCKVTLCRKFDLKDRVKEVVHIKISLNGTLHNIEAMEKSFTISLKTAVERLENQVAALSA